MERIHAAQLLQDIKQVFDGAEQRKEIGKAQAQDREAIIPQEFSVFVAKGVEGVK